jgi:DUF4097 and DUF4098 domain-containing protein YvlB
MRAMTFGKATAVFLAAAVSMTASGCNVGINEESVQPVELAVATNVTKFNLKNTVGDITVVADETATGVTATVRKVGKGTTKAEADQALADIVVSMAPGEEEGVVEANATHPSGSGLRSYVIDWTITTPPGVQVVITNKVGDIQVTGLSAPLNISNDVGDVDVEKVNGALVVDTRVGDIRTNSTGSADVESNVGDVRVVVHGAAAPVKAKSSVGDINVQVPRGWKSRATMSSNVGDIEIDSGPLSASEVKRSRKRCEATLNGGGEEMIEMTANVGDVELTAGEPSAGG